MIRLFASLVIIVCLFAACKESNYYSSSLAFDEDGWSYENTHKTTFEINDSLKTFDLYLDIEHSPSFEYQNIYCKLTTTFPSQEKTEQQLPINFADNKGRWYGKCNNSSCKLRVVLQQQVSFKDLGKYTIEFEQYSREKKLENIKSLDFIIQ